MADSTPKPVLVVEEAPPEERPTTPPSTISVTSNNQATLSPNSSPAQTRDRRRWSSHGFMASQSSQGRSRRVNSLSSSNGRGNASFPGDLGAKDPRRPRSPDPSSLPGDLGASDPRRPRSVTRTPAEAERLRQLSSEGGVRIHEDPEPEPEPEIDRHDSDDDADDDGDGSQRGRGRKRPEPGRTTSGKSTNLRADSEESEPDSHSAAPSKPDPTKGESKLMFEKDVPSRSAAANYARRRLVQPSTAFDAAPSAYSTPLHSDDETHNELIAAQKLSLTMSQIHSTPSAHRVIRQIIRGDFEYFQKQAETGHQRQRMYLVATDISPEAEYALEWTIGTVLRDGDTLFAVYAADEESVGAGEVGLQVGHGADSVRDIADVVKFLQLSPQAPASPGPSPLAKENAEKADASHNIPPSAENERRRALEEISSRCIRLLRKTRLQVRVVVEVFHCKSPRHMITEVIDFLTPTLVIIGSRGQSAMKGVLLGSFSNYLVTKSSVPVMVARKKLKKHSKASASSVHKDGLAMPYRGSGRSGRFSNIIEVPRTAGLRVNSWDEVGID